MDPRPRSLYAIARRALLLAGLLSAPAWALDVAAPVAPRTDLADYHHRRWGIDDGAPPAITSMAQTTDGWLWLGTPDGLFRFDGLRFYRWPLPPGLGLNRNLIRYLRAGPRGELYIGRSAEGIAVLHPDGRLQEMPAGPATGKMVAGVVVDGDGSVWIAGNGIHRLHEGRWQTIEAAPEWGLPRVRSFLLDRRGGMWVAREDGVWRLDRRAGRFAPVTPDGGELLPAPDGRLWLEGAGGAMRPLTGRIADGAAASPWSAPASLGAGFSADGTLWSLHCPQGVCTVPAAAERAGAYRVGAPAPGHGAPPHLSGKNTGPILSDREGNIWVATEGGIDRFRRKRIRPTELGGEGAAYSLAADGAGRVWAANAMSGRMWQLLPGRAVPVGPRYPVSVLAPDAAGRLLLGGRRGIWRADADGEMPLPPGPDGKPVDRRMLGILDDGKVLWTATAETGLLAWDAGAWRAPAPYRLPSRRIYQSAPAGGGRMWLATGDGELFHYDVATRSSRPPIDIRALGMTAAIFPGADLLLSGDNGSGVIREGRLRMLRASEPNALRNVSGLVIGPDGDRWLNGAAGLVHVTAADWGRTMADPALPLRYEVFDTLDGYPGRAVFESRWRSAWSGDGRHLWLVATGGVVTLDTAGIERNRVAPVPALLSLSTDGASYPVAGAKPSPIRLAPGTRTLRLDFTAPSLRMPERLRFEYRLDGVDADWQDAGTRRTTSYTSLAPGDYVFRLRAVNEDGVRSSADAVLPLRLAPMFWQTLPFRLGAGALLAALLALAYRYRVRYLTRRVAERLHVRMAERERIARTLHDTFLQTVQSLMLRVDAIAAALPADAPVRRELDEALAHAGGALGEGRAQLQELRDGGAGGLEERLRDTVAQLRAIHPAMTIGLRSAGRRRPVDAEAGHEAGAIAREALHNACIHAGADQVRALLDYGDEALVLTVSDNGRGIDGAVLRKGSADGHWGLVGMRERAGRIGARLEIGPGAEGGTVVRLSVPAGRAYRV